MIAIEFKKKTFFSRRNDEKFIKQQSKQTFTEILTSYTNYDSYTSKQKELLVDIPFYKGFAVSESSKSHMYESHYDKLQPFFGEKVHNYIIWILIALY